MIQWKLTHSHVILTCKSFYVLWNTTKEDIMKNVSTVFVPLNVNRVQNNNTGLAIVLFFTEESHTSLERRLEALRYAVNFILHDVPVCKKFSQCQCNIVRSLSCYSAVVRMSLHQPNVTLIYPADSERQQKPAWDVVPLCDWQVLCNPCGFTPEIHRDHGAPRDLNRPCQTHQPSSLLSARNRCT